MGAPDAGLIEDALDAVHQSLRRRGVQRRSAGVTGEGGREHIVGALEPGKNELPGAPGVGEAVHADERRSGAAPVRRGEASDYQEPRPRSTASSSRSSAASRSAGG